MQPRLLASILGLALAVVPAVAAADEPEGKATAAVVGKDTSTAFDQAVDDHYAALSDTRVCAAAHGCKSTLVHRYPIDRKAGVELRKATADYGDVYAFVVTDGDGNAWSAAVLDGILEGDCGMGKCVDTRFGAIKVKRVDTMLWITAQVKATVTHDETRRSERRTYQLVTGCRLGPQPACATVQAGDAFTPGSASYAGSTVKLTVDHAKRAVALTFPP
ncbi:MAG TPA: hypothetical protein VHE35_36745 [Kofleriaceae bacterium]|nr:hypothetical protein [Kofleriaceae bacterium]